MKNFKNWKNIEKYQRNEKYQKHNKYWKYISEGEVGENPTTAHAPEETLTPPADLADHLIFWNP